MQSKQLAQQLLRTAMTTKPFRETGAAFFFPLFAPFVVEQFPGHAIIYV